MAASELRLARLPGMRIGLLVTGQINLTSGPLVPGWDQQIVGTSPDLLTVDGQGLGAGTPVFSIGG